MERTSCLCMVTLGSGLIGLLISCPTNSFARPKELSAAELKAQTARLAAAISQKRNDKTKALYNQSNRTAWKNIIDPCIQNVTPACAQAAIVETTTQCSVGATFFKKSSRKWKWINLGLILASAAFTAVGASSIADAKVYGVLGGTTGLGAATTTVNANASGDQNGIAAINKTLQDFLAFVQKGGKDGKPPDPETIYRVAPIYAAECSAAANNAAGGTGR